MAGKSYKTVRTEAQWDDALSAGTEGVREVAEELSEWRSNLEEAGLDNVPKYEGVGGAADQLDSAASGLESVDVDLAEELVEALSVNWAVAVSEWVPRHPSRQVRLDNACSSVRAAADFLSGLLDDYRGAIGEAEAAAFELGPEQDTSALLEDLFACLQEADELGDPVDAVNAIADKAEGVVVPGMY
jgi:hypothetical protein